MNKKLLWGVGIVAVLIVAFLFFRSRAGIEQAAADEGAADTVAAFIGDLSASATASGQLLPQREATLTAASPAQVTAVNVRVGDTVAAGDLLVLLDDSRLLLAVHTAEESLALAAARLADLLAPAHQTEIATAEANITSAQAQLDDLLAGPSANEIALAETSVNSANASLNAAYADLGSTAGTITQSQIAAAEAALLAAQLQLDAAIEANEENTNAATHEARLLAQQAVANAQAQLDDLRAGPSLGAAQGSVSAADYRLEGSQAELEQTLAGATEAEIAAARATLAQAEASLADLLAGPTAAELRSAEAEVEQARLSLADAEEALADATIVAPFDGLITSVYVNKGELAAGAVVDIAAVDQLELVLDVDEVDIGSFSVGQPATFSFEAWPDRLFESEIVSIAPSANQNNNALVTYEVHLRYAITDLPLLLGLTANANLITAQREEVLLVPNAAITPDRAAGKYYVDLKQADGTFAQVEVTIGLRDGDNTQITSGLTAGDQLGLVTSQPVVEFGPGAR